MEKEMTFEEIYAHIQNSDISEYQEGGRLSISAIDIDQNPKGVLTTICKIYHIIRPILKVLSSFPLIPKKWRRAIDTFIELMDKLCPKG